MLADARAPQSFAGAPLAVLRADSCAAVLAGAPDAVMMADAAKKTNIPLEMSNN